MTRVLLLLLVVTVPFGQSQNHTHTLVDLHGSNKEGASFGRWSELLRTQGHGR